MKRPLARPGWEALASANLFYPEGGRLLPYRPEAVSRRLRQTAVGVGTAIDGLLDKENYPCVAALSSIKGADYLVGVYSGFGTGEASGALARDLSLFKAVQAATKSPFLSLWAVFDDTAPHTEEEFEGLMWAEISSLSATMPKDTPWDPNFSSDPAEKNFCFSFDGDAYFLVGMHPRGSRLSRRFPLPAVVFNLYAQFEALGSAYGPMVELNRRRDRLFQGNLNPTVERWADEWESIQFSGRDNPPDWKCPFRRS